MSESVKQPETASEKPVNPPTDEATSKSKDSNTPTLGYFTVPEIAASVRTDIKRTKYPKWNDSIVAAKVEQSVAQVAAGGALPIDVNNSKADGLIEKDLHHAREAQEKKSTTAAEAALATYAVEKQTAEVKPPLSFKQRLGIVGSMAALTLAGVFGLKWLLASSFDEILFRSYYESLGTDRADNQSPEAAHTLAFFLATTLLGAKAVAVLASWGRISQKVKLGMLFVAAAFSLCFAAARLSLGFNWTAVMLSGVEFAILLSFTLLLLAVATVLKEDAERADQYLIAQAKLKVELRHADLLRQEASEAKADYEKQRQDLSQREDAARRASLNQDLARKTVEAEALISYAELISEHAQQVRRHPGGADEKVENPSNPGSLASNTSKTSEGGAP